MKRFSNVVLLMIMIFSFIVKAITQKNNEIYVNENEINIVNDDQSNEDNHIVNIKPRFANDFRTRKVNVRRYNEWSSYKRVSDNIVTGDKGGRSKYTVNFNVVVNGNI